MTISSLNISVIGAGAWGTALAIALSRQHLVTLFTRTETQAQALQTQRCNTPYLPNIRFPANLQITADLSQAVIGSELILIVTPTAGLRSTLAYFQTSQIKLPPIIWACKGFEQHTALLPHEVMHSILPDHPCAVLSGPSFAKEVALAQPCALTLASQDIDFAVKWMNILSDSRLRLYASHDMIGVEVGGAVKNILAIAAGISDGLNLGMNARAALITRGLAEMTRLNLAMGGQIESMLGLAGVGDLILTATGGLSRNRRVGERLSQNIPLSTILAELGHVAEGVATTQAVLSRAAALQVNMPIAEAVNHILFENAKAVNEIDQLLERNPRIEF